MEPSGSLLVSSLMHMAPDRPDNHNKGMMTAPLAGANADPETTQSSDDTANVSGLTRTIYKERFRWI